MSSDKKVEFVEPDDEEEVELSEEEEEIDLEDEELELDDEDLGNVDMMTAFAGILRGTFHLPPSEGEDDDEDEDEEDTKNICEVLAELGDGIKKSMDTQNKILLKILTQLSK